MDPDSPQPTVATLCTAQSMRTPQTPMALPLGWTLLNFDWSNAEAEQRRVLETVLPAAAAHGATQLQVSQQFMTAAEDLWTNPALPPLVANITLHAHRLNMSVGLWVHEISETCPNMLVGWLGLLTFSEELI